MSASWPQALWATGLSLALAWWLMSLLETPKAQRLPAFMLLALSCALALSWAGPGRIDLREAAWLTLGCAVTLGAAFAAGSSRVLLPGLRGAGVAVFFCGLGCCASRWPAMAAAVSRLGSGFLGQLLAVGLPLALAGSLAAAAAAFLHPDLRGLRWRAATALLLAWALVTASAEWRLRGEWGFGPESLSQAASVPPLDAAREVSVAVLRPSDPSGEWKTAGLAKDGVPPPAEPYRFELRRQAGEGLSLDPESLEKLSVYLKAHRYRSVFARQALAAWRRGWLLWWDADAALQAAALRVPGRVIPDYRAALSLIQAGPLTEERLEALTRLHEGAIASPAGFEHIGPSQLIFEAFSAAFARFDDEPRARYWLGRIDNLWPINEKKVEVTPLQTLRDGSISGALLIDGRPASSVRVGLFLEVASEVTKKTSFMLGASAFPDSDGAFRFDSLGTGSYHLELQGTPQQLRGEVFGSPGVISVSESSPTVRLAPILMAPGSGSSGEARPPAGSGSPAGS